MNGWRKVQIADIGQVFDGPHATPKTVDEGPVFLGIPALNSGRLDLTDTRHVTGEDFLKWTRRVTPAAGDIVFSYETKIGEAALIPDGLRCCLGRRMGLVRLDPTKCDPRYFLYQYISPDYQRFLASRTVHGATVDRLLLKDFPFFEFPLPPLPEQREIASILGALDDKIELNRRMAATLEEMARALYRSWFVDFDPVKAKAEGLAPAFMDEATAALFPDRFGDKGLPEGWAQVGLPEIATFLNGAALQRFPPAEGEESLPVIKIAELRNGVTSNSNRASVNLPSKYRIENGDVLFSWSGSLLQKVWTDGPGALNQHLFKVSSAGMPKWFHFFAVDQHMDEFRQIAQSKATTMGHIQRHHLDAALVCVSDAAVMKAADHLIGSLFDRMIALNIENRTLATLRDTLLPRLMSGELRVGEAQGQIEEVA